MLGDYLDGDAVAFVRHTEVPNQEALVVVNKSKQRLQQGLLVPHTHFDPKLWFKNLLAPDQHVQFYMASFPIDLPPESAAIYVPDDGHLLPSGSKGTNYAYFKPRILGETGPKRASGPPAGGPGRVGERKKDITDRRIYERMTAWLRSSSPAGTSSSPLASVCPRWCGTQWPPRYPGGSHEIRQSRSE